MASYKVADRAKEWTSYLGLAVGAIGAVVPQIIPVDHWAQYWGDAQIVLGALLVALPQTAGSTAVENDALSLLQALSAKVPPAYAGALQPFMVMLARGVLQPQAPIAQPAVQPVPGVLIPQQPAAPIPAPPVPFGEPIRVPVEQPAPVPATPVAVSPAD
jgi:hypothetical protein